jgi:DNA-binding winged helix-turn-helix (wHTH) protein
MEAGTQAHHHVRFKTFELNLKTGELSQRGVKIRLYGQPVDVLRLLIEHAGEVVTRETLQKALWPEDIFVDFDHSLNSTINRLRDALGDSADSPQLIQTVPRVGYRFIARVEVKPLAGRDGTDSLEARALPFGSPAAMTVAHLEMPIAYVKAQSVPQRKADVRWLAVPVLFAAATLLLYGNRPFPLPHVSTTVRLTSDPRFDKWLIGADASRIYMNVYPTAFGQVPVSGGNITITPIELVQRLRPFNSFPFARLSPDGSSFLVQGHRDPEDDQSEIWVIGSSGTPVQFLTRASSAGWSTDGKQVIYATPKRGIFTIPSAGGDPHPIRTLDGSLDPSGFEYSPDGTRVRFNIGNHKLMEMLPDGSGLHEILAGWHPDDIKCCGHWTPDGDFFSSCQRTPRKDVEYRRFSCGHSMSDMQCLGNLHLRPFN